MTLGEPTCSGTSEHRAMKRRGTRAAMRDVSAPPAPEERYVNSESRPPNVTSPGGVKQNFFPVLVFFSGFQCFVSFFCPACPGVRTQRGWALVCVREKMKPCKFPASSE